jgi:hypothetical protein|tara:strand:+ start:6819 stop:6977 length:159 start_codon:yes stop_codon:yes gene_type:complete
MIYTIFALLFNYEFSLPASRVASKPFDYETGIEMINYNNLNNITFSGTYEIV